MADSAQTVSSSKPRLIGIRHLEGLSEYICAEDTLEGYELVGLNSLRSHSGVVGIFLGYIPHKHRSRRLVLGLEENGQLPEMEATTWTKREWVDQIKRCLAKLHDLGILWRDVKTDNVLIDYDGNAIITDFGGGITMGWVDRHKYGTMEGEQQGLQTILQALGV